MKRIVWSISLLILLLNTLWIPLTYAEEYAQESEKTEVIGDIPTDDVVENDEGEEQSPQFPVNENFDNDQEPEIDPVEPVNLVVENPEELEVSVVDEWSWGVVEHPVVNPEDDTTWSWWNQWGENGDNPDALSWGNQEAGSWTWGQVSTETDFSGGNTESSWTGWSSTEISEDEGWDSWIISNITSALQDFLSTIRFFFVSDDNDYIKESKINWIETITLEDPENWETIIIMDRNLWAEDNDIQSENSYGNYYQWWNNNGFEEVNDSNVTSLLAVYSWKYEWIGYTRDNKFRVGSNDIWEEDEEWRSNYDELWYLWEDEEVQWPCPEGYHIPSIEEWNKLVSVWTKIHTQDEQDEVKVTRSTPSDTIEESLEKCWTWDFENQENCLSKEELPGIANLFMNELKLPRAWWYNNWEKEDSLWVYWTRTPWDLLYQSEVFSIEKFFWVTVNENDYMNRSNANSLRCFRNTEVSSLFASLSFNNDTLSLNDVNWYTITFDSNWGSSVPSVSWVQPTDDLEKYRPKTDPYRVWYMFLWWFDDLNNATRYKFQWTTITWDLVLYAKWAPFNDIIYTWTVEGTTYSITIMDRNLGATTTWAWILKTPESYGYYYQWWNNYWFYYGRDNANINTAINTKYNAYWFGPWNWFYWENFIKADPDWSSKYENNLWWWVWDNSDNNYDNGHKKYTRQWPCPRGYHVPSLWEWRKLVWLFMNNEYPTHASTSTLNNSWKTDKIWKGNNANYDLDQDMFDNIVNTFYIPSAWRVSKAYVFNRQWQTPNDDWWYRAPFWSSTQISNQKSLWFEIRFKDSKFNLWWWDDERSNGKAIRCFKDNDDYTITWKNFEDPNQSANEYIIETDYYVNEDEHPHYDGITPIKVGEKFIWWYDSIDESQSLLTNEDLSTMTISSNKIYIAKFIPAFYVDVEIIPSTWWTINWTWWYIDGQTVTLTGLSNIWYQFSWWFDEFDNLVSYDNPYIFTVDSSDWTWLKALFELKEYTVTVASNDISKGTIGVTQRPYTHGKRIEFSPNYDSWEYKFLKWELNGEDVMTWGDKHRTWNLVIEHLTWDLTVTGYFSTYDSCTFNWDPVLHWESVTGYKTSSETCPSQCESQVAICYNWTWDISDFASIYANPNCTTNWVNPIDEGYTLDSCPEHWVCSYKTWYTVSSDACELWDVKWRLDNCELWYHIEGWFICAKDTYSITYEYNNGTWNNPLTYQIDTENFTLLNPTRTWYNFIGWSWTALDGSWNKTVTITKWSVGDRKYEANWSAIVHNLIFDSNWWTLISSQDVIRWKTWTKPADPTKDGYSFDWWYWTGLEIPFDFTWTTITWDITVYAKWNLETYKITYYLDWWTGLENTWTYTIETDTFTLNNPSKLNYTFVWWTGTNLENATVEVTINSWSFWNREYYATYDCAYWRKIDWSCNIVKREDWLIDYDNWEYNDLEVDLSVTEPRKIIIMDRNLWAAVSGTGNNENVYGFYYQWWNNYGFPNWGYDNVSSYQVDAWTFWPWNYYVSDTFINNGAGWDSSSNFNLWWWTWDDKTSKTWPWDDGVRQWPCPNGYHIPSAKEWRKLAELFISWKDSWISTLCSNSPETCAMEKLMLPKTGNRDWKNWIQQKGSAGRFWTSTRLNQEKAYRIALTNAWGLYVWQNGDGANYSISNWMAVRCFKNVSSKPLVYELSWWVQTDNQTSTVVWWNEESWKKLTIPTKTGFVFEWWYLTSWYEEWTRVITNVITDYSDRDTVTLYAKWRNVWEIKVSYNVNWWYFPWDSDKIKDRIYEESNTNSWYYIIWTTDWMTPSRTWWMFAWWYLTWLETRWTWYLENDIMVYAKWLSFNDFDVKLNDDITITIMDRNLWAEASGTWCSNSDLSTCWYHFQWWNNYWFEHQGNWSVLPNWEEKTSIQATDWQDSVSTYYNSKWILKPVWYTPVWGNDNLRWWADRTNTSDTLRQWPCPDGYHVPTTNEWRKIGNLTSISSGDELRDILKLPYAGSRQDITAKVNIWSYGCYRSSAPSQYGWTYWGYPLEFSSGDTIVWWEVKTWRGQWYSVRCFKNTEKRALSFESKWGTEIASTQTVRWWETISNLPSPTRSNSTFSGWYMTPWYEEWTKVSVNYIWTWSGPVTLYAKWECKEWYVEADNGNACIKKAHTVTITSNNEDFWSVTSGLVVAQEWVSIITSWNELTIWSEKVLAIVTWNTQQYSYQFSWWNNTCGNVLTSDCSIEAEFTRSINSYTITFYSNGWTPVASQTKEYWTTWDKPADPTMNWYVFDAWYSDSELTQKYDFTELIERDIDLFAKWNKETYTISYEYNNGTWSNPATYDVETDSFTINNPIRTWYTFIGWSGTNLVWSWNKDVTIGKWSTWNREYEANWEVNKYEVIYKANWWEGVDVKTEATYDENYQFAANSFIRTWYTFVEWNTKEDGTWTGYTVGFSEIWKTTTWVNLYAKWRENSYNVAYKWWDWAEGTVTWATYNYTQKFNLAANAFTKNGYTFSWWRNGENHHAAGDELSRMIAEDGATVTFTAEWNTVPYSITYVLNDWRFTGWVVNPTTYTIESATINVGNPEKTWYIFLWWTGTDLTSLSSDVVIENWSTWDRTYYANWKARDDIKITVRHYLQDLDANNNIVLTTYSISWTVEEEWTADSIITLSDYQQAIEWYSYDSGKVDGNVVTTTTVKPDWSRIIELFYTRNTYSFSITTTLWSTTEWSSLDWDYYYWAKITLSWDINNDCFVWSGWGIQWATLENNMKQTSFHMSSSNVTVKSSVREKTYNLIFNGNSANSWSMSPITWIRCTQEVALPYNSFVKSGHTFTWWTDGEKQYANWAVIQTLTTWDDVTVEFIAIWDINYYPVVWKDYDWDVLFEEEFPYMETPVYHWETPSRDADAQYTYTFAWWTPEEHVVTWSQVYTAVYNKTLNEYTVTWDVNWTKTMETYKYWKTPNFTWSKHKDPDEQYEYSFSWWSPEVASVTGDITYTATYTSTLRKYPIVWLNYDWSELRSWMVQYGDIPEYGWATPTRPSDPGSSYEFIWWNPTPAAITWVTYYRAVFSGNQNEYTITWVNYDNSTLEVDTWVAYWSIPSYDWVTPTKASDSQYDYEFSWWSPVTWMVVGDQTYVASYTSIPRTYTVTWENSDGTIIKIDTWVSQWTQAVYSWDNPSSWSSAEYDYEFIWWNPTPWVINSDTTYTALYKSTKRKYLIRFVNGEIELQSWMVEYGDTPVYTWDTPEKSWDAQYSYNYVWWNPWISAVTWDITYEVKFDAIVNKYSVTFVNEDGSSVLKPAKKYDYWTSRENVEKPGNPTKPSDAQYDYEFLRWIPVVSQITWDVEFKATYTWTIRTYTVTWKNDDGTVLETDYNVPYWTTPSYNSATPTKQGSSQYEYTFIWWDLEISPVNWDITYIAQFIDTTKTYTITWKNGNIVLETDNNVPYWSIPSYDWATPTKASDSQYDYEFSWWNPATWLVVWDQTYVANFISKLRTYTVKWKNGDIVLKTDNNVPYWTTPTYSWATPVKTWTAQYSYTFDKWTPDVGPISSDTMYNAIFKESINKYVVTWENDDGSFLDSWDVSYWETPVYSGPTPTKVATPQYTYTFSNHWDPEVTSVTTGAKYTAKFNSTVNKYTIKFVDWDGNVLQSGQLEYGAIPEYTGANPTKTADAQYTYEFNNKWSPAISEVTWDLTYEAQFNSTVNKYTITWKDWDNKILKTEQVAYGTTPSYDGETPTKTATAQYTYTFNNTWSPEVVSVTNNATYTAQFTETVNKYTIRFIDYDDSLIVEKQVDYWTTSWNYKPADPVREGYTFIWWSPSLETVTGPRTYKATYTINQYTVTPVVWTWVDRIEWWWKYDYGTEIVLTWYAKEWYHFEWWYTVKAFTVTVWPNSIDVRIHAIWNTYKVRFQPWEGEWTMDDQEFTYGLTWTLKANSFTRDGYTFTWWSDEDGNVYANKWKVYNLATWWILLFTALWKTWVVPPEPPTPSWWGAAAWWGRLIPTEDEHESADLQTWAIVQTWNDDVLSPDEVKPEGYPITWTIVNTWGDSHVVTWYTTRTQEEMDAYKYAYKYHITTLAPREAAMPDEYVQRWHMAKMVVNYALNVLHRKLPEKLPKQCKWKDWKNAWESKEIKDYAEKACALWLMWIDMEYFQPYKLVTRAQFWTIFGRLLWWKLVSKPYYAEHLARLKKRWIMTQIDRPEERIEIRKRAWLMFMRSEKYFKVK